MFGLIESLTKATIATALLPVGVAVDIVSLPASAENGRPAFDVSGALLGALASNVSNAVEPERR